ncbi:MAG: hypothetical protein DMG92_17435 [Acidobacteria bacterium]|nr:MAG: hypothetical protein DMG92_17435 [Acidobacteriota bacterium]
MRARFHLILTVGLVAMVAPLMFVLPSPAQQGTKRLIMKDGSYQVTTKWEIQGDRVHYFSAERNEWEDVPNSLVDWQATDQYEKDRAAGKMSPEAIQLEKELQEQRAEDELRSPHVAPGLRLPEEGGVYALDTYLTEPQLVPLDQTGGEVNRHTGHNVLRGVINPVAGSKHTIELPGANSKLQIHSTLPTIYIDLDAGQPEDQPESAKKPASELPWDRFRIVRAQVKSDKRIMGEIKIAVYGKASQEEQIIPADAEQLGEGWIKLTPKAPLQPGEYAVAELLGKQGMNSYVWDFGVHPEAPANMSVIKPETSQKKSPEPLDDTEKLKKRE